jgi:CBS-domain-containing membrane protein
VSRPERPAPPPLEGNDRVITGVITCGFVVALVVLLVLRGQLPHADRWWIWVAAFGTFLGLFGLVYVPILKRQRERAAARRAQDHGDQDRADQDRVDQDRADQDRADGARRP